MLYEMPGTICYMDDVVVFGETEEQLEQRLCKQTTNTSFTCSTTLNKETCLQPYDYKIEHTVGKSNLADSLSRLPLPETQYNEYVETYVDRVLSVTVYVQAMNLEDIKQKTTEEDTLKTIVETGK